LKEAGMSLRAFLAGGLLAIAGAVAAAAQSSAPADTRTVTGCVEASSTERNRFTLADGATGPIYVLKGMSVRDFVGKRVEITARPPRRLRITGGLYPSPNAAAQAGAIDPGRAAVEALQNGPYGNERRPTIELEVRSARIVAGECPVR
jgi:hypothetical protein